MHSAAQTVELPAAAEVSAPITLSQGALAVSDLRSARMEDMMRLPSTEELRRKMRVLGAHEPALRTADLETKIAALSNYCQAYLPLREGLTFASTLLAKIREIYRAKKFSSEEFRLYFHANAEVMNGERLRPLPACLSSITGTGFTLTGPSLMGRTAILQRLVEILGRPFFVKGEHPAPSQMFVMPLLYLPYPTCGTLRGLIRDMRQKVMAGIGHYKMNVNALSDMDGPNGENVAIALCTLLNVGAVVLDGSGFANVNGKTEAILKFLVKLRQFTGIPVVISGTSAFMYSASYMGNLASNLFNGPSLHLNPIRMPNSGTERQEAPESKKGIWVQMNEWHWKRGIFEPPCPMPVDLPTWTHQVTFGRLGWLAQGFESLHLALLVKPELLQPGALSEARVKEIFNSRLQLQNGVRTVMATLHGTPTSKSKLAFLKNLDHLPTVAFDEPQVREWLDEALLRRV